MRSYLFLSTFCISSLILAEDNSLCSNSNQANFISNLSKSIDRLTDETQDCKSLTMEYLDYTKSLSLRVTETEVVSSTTYFIAYKKYKKNNQTLREGLKGLGQKYPEVIKNCNFTPGDTIDAPFLGEPANICLSAAVHYDLSLLKDHAKAMALGEAGNEIYYAIALQPGGNASKILNYVNTNCLEKNKADNDIQIYDIPVFENNLANFTFFYDKENKEIKKNFEDGKVSTLEKISISCTKALEKIDDQSKHWHSMVSAIDTSYALAGSVDMLGKKRVEQYTYKYTSSHAVKEFRIFPTILRMASLILSSDGYLNQNIQIYQSQCVSKLDANSNALYEIEAKSDIDYIASMSNSELKNLQTSMDSIASKEFNNFKAPALPSNRAPSSDQASVSIKK